MRNRPSRNPVSDYLIDEKYSIEDLLDLERLSLIFKDFSKLTGLTIRFVSFPDLKFLVPTAWQDICVKFHRAFPVSEVVCRQSNQELLRNWSAPEEVRVITCGHGLVDMATPIVIEGKILAALLVGQIFFEEPDESLFKKQAEKYGYDVGEYLKALRKVPVLAQEQVESALIYLRNVTVTFIEENLKHLRVESYGNELKKEVNQRREAEARLRQSEASYRGLFDSVSEAIYVQARDGSFLDVNRGAVEMYGFPREYFIGKMPADVGAPGKNDLKKVELCFRKALKGEPQQFEFWGLRSNGEIFLKDVRLYKGTYFGDDVVIALAQDITQRRQAEDTLKQHLKELLVLHSISQVGTKALGIDDLIKEVTEIVAGTFKLDIFGILLYDAKTGMLVTHPSYVGEFDENNPVIIPIGQGITGHVAASGKPCLVRDTLEDSRYIEVNPGMRSELCVPIKSEDELIGVINAESRQVGFFDKDDLRLFVTIGSALATSIERLRFFEAEQTRRKEAEILRDVTAALTSTLEMQPLLKIVLDSAAKIVPYDSASVILRRGRELEIVAGSGLPQNIRVPGSKFKLDKKWKRLILEKKPLVLKDAQAEPSFEKSPDSDYIRGWMGVPLLARGEVIGALCLDSRQINAYTDAHAAMLQTFANQVAVVIENVRLFESEHRRWQEAETLRQATSAVASTLDRDEAIRMILEQLAGVVPYDSASVQELKGDHLEIVGGRGWPDSKMVLGMRFPVPGNNPNTIVVQTLKPFILGNAPAMYEEFRKGVHSHIISWLGVPLIVHEQLIGILAIDSREPDYFTSEKAALVTAFANQAAVAMENARLYKETRQRLAELETVNRISTVLREAQTLTDMLTRLMDETLGALQFKAGAIWLYDPAREALVEALSRGWFTNIQDGPVMAGEGIVGIVFESGQALVSRDLSGDSLAPRSWRQVAAGWGGVCVPIRTLQEVIGVIFFAVELPRQVLPEDIHLLSTISEMAGNAIRRSQLHEQTQNQLQRLASLRVIDMAINTILDLRVTLGILTEHILSQLKVDAASVLLLNPRTQMLQHAASAGFRTEAVTSWQVYIANDIASKAIRSRSTIFIENLREITQRGRLTTLAKDQFISYFCVPLIAKGQVKGVLEIYHRSRLEPDADWKNFLETMAEQTAIAVDNAVLFEELQKMNVDLVLAYDAAIEGWSKSLDLRGHEDEGHSRRLADLTLKLATAMGVAENELVHIRRGALLHDIGTMGVPDSILSKAGPLTESEWELMRRHPLFAYEMLNSIPYLRPTLDIPYCHHERWDGSGYPRGLAGKEIPLAARIFAVTDVWNALISDRPYRQAWERETALGFMQKNSGILFDPRVVEAFLNVVPPE